MALATGTRGSSIAALLRCRRADGATAYEGNSSADLCAVGRFCLANVVDDGDPIPPPPRGPLRRRAGRQRPGHQRDARTLRASQRDSRPHLSPAVHRPMDRWRRERRNRSLWCPPGGRRPRWGGGKARSGDDGVPVGIVEQGIEGGPFSFAPPAPARPVQGRGEDPGLTLLEIDTSGARRQRVSLSCLSLHWFHDPHPRRAANLRSTLREIPPLRRYANTTKRVRVAGHHKAARARAPHPLQPVRPLHPVCRCDSPVPRPAAHQRCRRRRGMRFRPCRQHRSSHGRGGSLQASWARAQPMPRPDPRPRIRSSGCPAARANSRRARCRLDGPLPHRPPADRHRLFQQGRAARSSPHGGQRPWNDRRKRAEVLQQ